MNFIKKVFGGQIDESIHLQFQKFSRGEFRNRAVIEAKKSKNTYTIKTSSEFSNELILLIADKAGNNKIKVSGCIVSTQNLKEEPVFSDFLANSEVKQFQGVKKYMVNNEISGSEIISLIKKNPKNFFALSFEYGSDKLKITPKAPKSGKPSSKEGEGPKADFCTLKTEDSVIAKSFVFEKDLWSEAKIVHTYLIEGIILPEGEKDYARIREMAKRKGKIIRKAVIDEKEIISEREFEA